MSGMDRMQAVVPILGIAESRKLESELLQTEGEQRIALHRAGHLLGQAIQQDFQEIAAWPDAPEILLLAGKGHNTGDALLAAGDLLQWHPHGRLSVLWDGENTLMPLVREIWRDLQQRHAARIQSVILGREQELLCRSFTLLVDGVFGLGFRPPLPGNWRSVLETIQSRNLARIKVSVDLPSGMSEAGESVPLPVDFTYAMGIAKSPLFRSGAESVTGRIRYLDIGFWREESRWSESALPGLFTDGVLEPLRIPRPATADKRHMGRVGIVAGSQRYPGAPLLTTLAALQAGAGLVTAVVPESLVPTLAAQAPEAIWMGADTTPEGTLSLESLRDILSMSQSWDAMVIGPGLTANEETFCLVQELVRQFHGALVLDADALRAELSVVLQQRAASAGPVILLPHAGEWQRMAKTGLSEEESRRWAAVHRVVLVRKGPITRLTDGAKLCFSTRGGPVLGRGGSGDMLAGMAGALLARYHTVYAPLQIAGMAVYWHGAAAEQMARHGGENAVRNRQLLDFLAPALRNPSS